MHFGEIKSLRQQYARYAQMYMVARNMMDHVEERETLEGLSEVLDEFKAVHGNSMKKAKLDEFVGNVREIAANVNGMRSDLGMINEAFVGDDVDIDETSLDAELEQFLLEGDASSESVSAQPQISVSDATPAAAEIVTRVEDFPEVPTPDNKKPTPGLERYFSALEIL